MDKQHSTKSTLMQQNVEVVKMLGVHWESILFIQQTQDMHPASQWHFPRPESGLKRSRYIHQKALCQQNAKR